MSLFSILIINSGNRIIEYPLPIEEECVEIEECIEDTSEYILEIKVDTVKIDIVKAVVVNTDSQEIQHSFDGIKEALSKRKQRRQRKKEQE